MGDETHDYEGGEVTVQWDGRLCIHIGECGRAQGDLFVTGRKPWCQPDVSSLDDVVNVVERCPAGALTYVAKKPNGPAEKAAERNTVTVANHGPLYVQGDLRIEGAPDDMPGVRFRAALCRCGASENKPFCDNQHDEVGYRDRGAIGQQGDGATGTGPLEIKRAKNGPLLLSGPVTLIAASGRKAWRGTKVALCRCGKSKDKPFCDGAHKAAGFTAD